MIETIWLIFLNNLDFQILKGDFLNKVILGEPGFGVTLKIGDCGVQPDGFAQVELQTDFLQRIEDFMGAGIVRAVFDDSIH